MALPQVKEARGFYQVAKQRLEDAVFLFGGERNTGAVYLAGYSVECMLKALVLSVVSRTARGKMLGSFRGGKAHDYDWLKGQYSKHGGTDYPAAVGKRFAMVNTWTTDWRYKAGTTSRREAEAFLEAARAIMDWADGRL